MDNIVVSAWVNESCSEGTAHIQRGNDSFSKTGLDLLCEVINVVAQCRRRIRKEGFADWSKLAENGLTFILTQNHDMDQSALQSIARSSVDLEDLSVSFGISYIGRTSVVISSKLHSRTLNRKLATSDIQYIYIEKSTKKPTSLPDWFVDKFKTGSNLQKPSRFEPLDFPANAFMSDIVISERDIDHYKHTNNISYVRHAVETIKTAVSKEYITNCLDSLNSVSILHSGESFLGDSVNIAVWKTGDETFPSLCCLFENKQKFLTHLRFCEKNI